MRLLELIDPFSGKYESLAESYPAYMSADAIYSNVIAGHHRPDDFDEGDLEDRIYQYPRYKLVMMNPNDIDDDQYELWGHEDDYADMIRNGSPIPPIVVHNDGGYYTIVDGTHQHQAALAVGVKQIPVYVGTSGSLNESFFNNHLDILIPIVNELMQTTARPLIYGLWKRSKNSVLALAAIKRLHDRGDPDPIATLSQMSDIDVPMTFLSKLAHEAGILTESTNGLLESLSPHEINTIATDAWEMFKDTGNTWISDHKMEYDRLGGDDEFYDFQTWLHPVIVAEVEEAYKWLQGAINYTNGKAEIFRAITAPPDWVSSGAYTQRNLGIFWSYEQNQAQAYCGGGKDHVTFIVAGLVDPSGIDWYSTVSAVMQFGYEEEEVTVFEGSDVEVVGIYKDGDNTNLIQSKQMLNAAEIPTTIVYHVTFRSNIPSIRKNGLKAQIGKNSADFGEPDRGVHVFYDMDTLEDAVVNWNMDWHEYEDKPLSAITLRIPTEWITGPSDSGYGMIARSIPASMIVDVVNNI